MKRICVVALMMVAVLYLSPGQETVKQSTVSFSSGQVFPLTESFVDAHGVLIYYPSDEKFPLPWRAEGD